jgi:H+/gluconate symporter-like permease
MSLVYALYRAYSGWFYAKVFSQFDNQVRHTTATIAHIQLIFGIWLYVISPITAFFFEHNTEALHLQEVRFFSIEHSATMLLAILIITIGSALAKRKYNDKEKFKTIALYYSIAFLLILAAIPWEFSPLVSRPSFRFF